MFIQFGFRNLKYGEGKDKLNIQYIHSDKDLVLAQNIFLVWFFVILNCSFYPAQIAPIGVGSIMKGMAVKLATLDSRLDQTVLTELEGGSILDQVGHTVCSFIWKYSLLMQSELRRMSSICLVSPVSQVSPMSRDLYPSFLASSWMTS